MRNANTTPTNVDAVMAEVRASKKYASLNADVVRRVAAQELAKRRTHKDTVLATKSKLHQIGGAYQGAMRYARWLDELREARDDAALREACARIMASHASSRERLPHLDAFCRAIADVVGPMSSVLDIACGLNPLAAPWMRLAPGARYVACDMYADLADFLREAMRVLKLDGDALDTDVLASPPAMAVDVALLLKAIPCLEQLDTRAGATLLENLNARYIVASFPTRSLGGRNVGMATNYSVHFEALCEGRLRILTRHEFANEIAFITERL